MKRNKFKWSLRPINFCMKFVLGCDLNVSKRKKFASRFFVPALGFFYVFIYFIVNGPCGLFSYKAQYDSMHNFDKENPLGINPMDSFDTFFIIQDTIKFTKFLSTPLIHLIFMGNVLLTTNWRDLRIILQKIQRQMSLDDVFHRKLRRRGLFALCLLILV